MQDDDLHGMSAMFQDDAASAGTDTVATPAPASPEPVAPPATDGAQPRDDSGRFAPKAPSAPEAIAPAPVTAKPTVDPEQFKGYLDERDKRQTFERENAELKRRLEALERQPAAPPPSIHDDPEAFARYQEQSRTSLLFDISENMARDKHGDDAVTGAMQWAAQKCSDEKARLGFSPFAVEYLKQKNPIDWAVKQQKRDKIITDVGEDPDAYVRRRAAELGLIGAAPVTEPQPATAAPQQPASAQPAPTPAPTRSLASAPTAGGVQTFPAGEFAAIETMFNR